MSWVGMANRPRGYGLTGEIKRKIDGKYDSELEQQARLWIEAILEKELKPGSHQSEPLGLHDFHAALKDGTVLCEVMNKIQPGSIRKVNTSAMAFKQMENISNFLTAIEKYGVSKVDSFQTVDLYESQNMTQVVNGIHALGRKAQKNGFNGPSLGLKEADANPRNFTEEQLKAGEGVIGLQMGTNTGASQAGMNFGKSRHIID